MENLKNLLLSEIPKFRELGHKFENKEISSLEFKGTSGEWVYMLIVVEKSL